MFSSGQMNVAKLCVCVCWWTEQESYQTSNEAIHADFFIFIHSSSPFIKSTNSTVWTPTHKQQHTVSCKLRQNKGKPRFDFGYRPVRELHFGQGQKTFLFVKYLKTLFLRKFVCVVLDISFASIK